MSEVLFRFFSLADPNVRYVLAGTILLGIAAGGLGCFAVLSKRSLVGDAVAHSVLPGVCIAFMIVGYKDPFALLLGALVFGWLSLWVMDVLNRNSKLSTDAAIGIVLSVFFGLGILLLTRIQSSGNAEQTGLDAFLFGQAAAMLPLDVLVFGSAGLLVLTILFIGFKEFKLVAFNREFAAGMGYPVKGLEMILSSLMVIVITIGLQAVGVVLMSAMLIIPATAARYWSNRLEHMVLIAMLIGAFSGVAGSLVSFLTTGMPTGPWMVLASLMAFIISMLFAPNRGWLPRRWQLRATRLRIRDENMLKMFFHLEEQDLQTQKVRFENELSKQRPGSDVWMKPALHSLIRKGWVTRVAGKKNGYLLTENGRDEARRMVRLHRLWELYLTEKLAFAQDHVHDDAESMEHLLTPEIEAQLLAILNKPEADPHNKNIPYS